MCPLFLAPEGSKIKIKEIRVGRNLQKRLIDLGLGVGTICEIVKGSQNCGIIVKKENCKLGIGFGMASKIMVETI